jgi:hypothetical protein
MKYQAQVKFDLEDHLGTLSKEQIKEVTQDYIEVLDNESEVTVSNIQVDISEYPRSAGSIRVEGHEVGGLLPAMGVTHPWDQGLWIFPDDHPLAAIEREARRVHDEHASEPHRLAIKQQMLEMGNSTPEGEVEE